jgi:hypothetical protein
MIPVLSPPPLEPAHGALARFRLFRHVVLHFQGSAWTFGYCSPSPSRKIS